MSEQLLSDLNKFKSAYYTDNKKNVVFNKSSQKYDLAEKVCSEYGFETLIQRTIYIIPNTNKVFMDYLVLRTRQTTSKSPNMPSLYLHISSKHTGRLSSTPIWIHLR